MPRIRKILGADFSTNPNAFLILSALGEAYQATVLATGGTISNAALLGINNYIEGSIADSTWTRHSLFAPLAGSTFTTARVAINQSGAVNLAASGTVPTYSAITGIANVASSFLDFGLSPTAMNHTTGSAAIAAYYKSPSTTGVSVLSTASGNSNFFGLTPGNDGSTRFICNDYGSAAITPNGINQRLIATRQSTTVSKIFKNGVLATTSANASTAVPVSNVRITSEFNSIGAVIGCVLLFNGALSDAEVARVDARMATLIAALGR
jgi:hypothetical protein